MYPSVAHGSFQPPMAADQGLDTGDIPYSTVSSMQLTHQVVLSSCVQTASTVRYVPKSPRPPLKLPQMRLAPHPRECRPAMRFQTDSL